MASGINRFTFGTDGFRGIVGNEFNYDCVKKISQGFADFVNHKFSGEEKPKVVVGYDRRFMSDRFARTAAEIIAANGINVTLSSTSLPSPAVSLLTSKKFGFGFIITASHNNAYYNGIKIKQNGRSAPASVTAEIENYSSKAVPMNTAGVKVQESDFRSFYADYVKAKMSASSELSKLKAPAVVDFMYGSAADIPGLFDDGKIISLHTKHDPLFGSRSPRPDGDNLDEIIRTVKKNKASFGAAFDGDGDRFTLVTDEGKELSSSQTAAVLLNYLLSKKGFKKTNARIAATVSAGFLPKKLAADKDIPVDETPVGFKHISEKLLFENACFGVEESGGFAWKGAAPERDGIMTFMLVAEMLINTGRKVSELLAELEDKYGRSCFMQRDLPLVKAISSKHAFALKIKKKLPKSMLGKKISEVSMIDGIKISLENGWWLLIRPSGTTSVMRTYAEADSEENTVKLLDTARKLASVK